MTTDPRLEVRGGVGGTTVGVDELVAAAGCLVESAELLGEVAVRMVSVAAEVATTAPLSLGTEVRAEAGLATAAASLFRESAAVSGIALAVRTTAWAYREVEEEVARTAAVTQDVVMAVAGHAAPTLVVGVVALDAIGVDLGALLDRVAWEVPQLADLGGGAEGLVAGLRSDPFTAPFVAPPHRVGGDRDERPPGDGVDRDPDQVAVEVLADSAAAWGLLSDEGSVRVTPVQEPSVDVNNPSMPSVSRRGPGGLADLARDQAAIPADGRVRVVEVTGDAGPAWIVEISGTQDWGLRAGANPFDLTTDVRSMAAESTVLAAGVHQALATAQARAAAVSSPGRDTRSEPVLLSGHSLGGIVAAGLASSAQFRAEHRVTHVLAMGSPIGKAPVPGDVQVLAVEHRQDHVPRLEGVPNPDRAGWVTVTRDLDGVPGVAASASAAHGSELYVESAATIDGSDDRSVAAWRAGATRFFPGTDEASTVVVRDYRITRIGPAP